MPSYSLQTDGAKECLAACAIVAAVASGPWVVASGLFLPVYFWAILSVASSSYAALIVRRLWFLSHQRGLEWSRPDQLTLSFANAAHVIAFWILFLTPKSVPVQ